MKSTFIILFAFFNSVTGFISSRPQFIKSKMFMTEQEEKPLGFLNKEFKFVGATPPLGFFDPLGFVEKSNEKTIKKFREAELQHGRVAMVSSLILPFLDIVTKQPAINVLRLSTTNMQLVALWLFAMYEGNRILAVYDNPFKEETQFSLKPDAVPGQYYTKKEYPEEKLNKELNNGRLAMLGVAGYIAQELVTGQPIF